MNHSVFIVLIVSILKVAQSAHLYTPKLDILPIELLAIICCMEPSVIPSLAIVSKDMYAKLTVNMAPDKVYFGWMEYRFEGKEEELKALKMYNISPYIQGHSIFKDVDTSCGLALSTLTPQPNFEAYLQVTIDNKLISDTEGEQLLQLLMQNTDKLCLLIHSLSPHCSQLTDHLVDNPKVATTIVVVLALSEQWGELRRLHHLLPGLLHIIMECLSLNFGFDDDEMVQRTALFYASGVAACICMSSSFGPEHIYLLGKHELIPLLLGRGYIGASLVKESIEYQWGCLRLYNKEPKFAPNEKDVGLVNQVKCCWGLPIPEQLACQLLLLHKVPKVEIPAMCGCEMHIISALLCGSVPFDVMPPRNRYQLIVHYGLQARLVALLEVSSCEADVILNMRDMHRLHRFSVDFVTEAYSYYNDKDLEVLVRVAGNLKVIFGGDWKRLLFFYQDTDLRVFLLWAEKDD